MENQTPGTATSLEFGYNSTTANITAAKDRSWYPLFLAITYMRHICLPTIFFLGTFGNIMTIIITQRKSFEKSIINMYFTAVAVSDMVVLSSLTFIWWMTNLIGYDVTTSHVVLCKIHTWLYSVSQTTSCWYLVFMTVHRAMSVVWPHRVNLLCTRRRVILVLIGVLIFMTVFYSHYIIWIERVPVGRGTSHMCIETDEHYKHFFSKIFVYIELIVYSVLPFLILVVSNSVMVWKLHASVKTASKYLTGGDSEQVEARVKTAKAVTLMVIVVSLSFLVLTLPNMVYYILSFSDFLDTLFTKKSPHDVVRIFFINDVCALLSMANSAVNFYLYCLTGRRFREEFIKAVCCRRGK